MVSTMKRDKQFAEVKKILVKTLVDLTNETGVLHHVNVHHNGNQYSSWICQVSITRKYPKRKGILNWLARALELNETVITITHSGQIWCCNYWLPSYYLTALKIKELFDQSEFEEGMVIIGSD